jgi:hypothetical protein
MKRLMMIMALGVLLPGLFSCGSSGQAGFEAVVVVPSDESDAEVGPGTTLASLAPVLIKVVKSGQEATPIPDARITIFGGGFAAGPCIPCPESGFLYKDQSLTVLAGDGFVWKTSTDDNGVVRVFLAGTTDLCATTTDLKGAISVEAVISSDEQTYSMPFTVKCSS